jgi:hypothetical protein
MLVSIQVLNDTQRRLVVPRHTLVSCYVASSKPMVVLVYSQSPVQPYGGSSELQRAWLEGQALLQLPSASSGFSDRRGRTRLPIRSYSPRSDHNASSVMFNLSQRFAIAHI